MGEAKRRKIRDEERFPETIPISRARFNLYTMGTRYAAVCGLAEEISWWATEDEQLLGMVARCTTDNDFVWMVFARDRIGRFRCADLGVDVPRLSEASSLLRMRMSEVFHRGEIEVFGTQGDETNSPLDPFLIAAGTDPDSLHPNFKLLAENPSRAPARKVLKELALWLAPNDPHLVSEFQTNGFDQRLWEFYLWAAFREFFLDVDQYEAPDFRCQAPNIDCSPSATVRQIGQIA